jgi:foldase protein PrsA
VSGYTAAPMRKLVVQRAVVCGLFAALIAILAGCGGGVPGNSVATVGGQTIKKSDFEHRLVVTFLGSASQTNPAAGSPTPASVPTPPAYKGCIAAARKAAPKPAKGQPVQTTAALKAQCAATYTQLHDSVLQTLIQADWIIGESKDQGIKVTAAAVTKQFNTLKKQQFPKNADYVKFLKTSHLTVADLRANVMLQLLTNKLRTKIISGKVKITPAAIRAYYNKNKTQFGTPEKLTARIILNPSKTKAEAALKALQHGGSWTAIAKKFSTDTTKSTGGLLSGITKGQEDAALNTLLFSAKKGQLMGPTKTTFGYYVYVVNAITPGVQQTVAQATSSIKTVLTSQDQQNALNKFVTTFTKKWTAKTSCRAGYVVSVCKNYKKPKATTPTAAATTPEPAAPTTVPSTVPSTQG